MNVSHAEVLKQIYLSNGRTQKELLKTTGYPPHKLKDIEEQLISDGLITSNLKATFQGRKVMINSAPKRAIILAAGDGRGLTPLNFDLPKGLLKVRGERLIEREIKQLHAHNVLDITLVVGVMAEKYNYLHEKFQVNIVENADFDKTDSLASLALVKYQLNNCYIVPCDVYFLEDPFSSYELYSWSGIQGSKFKNGQISREEPSALGLAYVTKNTGQRLQDRLDKVCNDSLHKHDSWDFCLLDQNEGDNNLKIFPADTVREIDTYDDLRAFDPASPNLNNEALTIIERCLDVLPKDITNVVPAKKGMTNRSFIFQCHGKKYMMRIPGEGTGQLINRNHEYNVYQVLHGRELSDPVYYLDPSNGFKLTGFLPQARNCDPNDENDVFLCMQMLRKFHELGLQVNHRFDLADQIENYEKLFAYGRSKYPDYEETKANVKKLIHYVNTLPRRSVLCHIDANCDNFIFYGGCDGSEKLCLIDWEYAGMQDPDIDIAMFALYSHYDQQQTDQLIAAYYPEGCALDTRYKIYSYVAICGLLWSNWCEFKASFGIDFGKYSLHQYLSAKKYYQLVASHIPLGEIN